MADNKIVKDEEHHILVPDLWRNTLKELVDLLVNGDFESLSDVKGVREISEADIARIITNIEDYGCQLTSLPEVSWETSVCQWMQGYWNLLIDLFAIEEGISDLVLSVRVYESEKSYIFEVQSVYVP